MTAPSGAEAAAGMRVVDLAVPTDTRWDELVRTHRDGRVS